MSKIGDLLKREQNEINSLFKEELELRTSDICDTYSKQRILSIDGELVEENKFIIIYFYQEDIYIPFDDRDPDYRGSLVAYDMGGNYNIAKYFYKNKLKVSETNKLLSIHEVIDDLYANRNR